MGATTGPGRRAIEGGLRALGSANNAEPQLAIDLTGQAMTRSASAMLSPIGQKNEATRKIMPHRILI